MATGSYSRLGATPTAARATIGTASQLLAPPPPNQDQRAGSGVLVKALKGNTGTIYVGGSTVTAANGYPLEAGESEYFPVDDPSRLWVIASAAGQIVGVWWC